MFKWALIFKNDCCLCIISIYNITKGTNLKKRWYVVVKNGKKIPGAQDMYASQAPLEPHPSSSPSPAHSFVIILVVILVVVVIIVGWVVVLVVYAYIVIKYR